jgi:hypothetical protein
MSAGTDLFQGTWAEICWVELRPEERAASLPAATSGKPLIGRVRGTADRPVIGKIAAVVTRSGRRVEGTVTAILPGYEHGFGQPLPAWIRMRDAIAVARREVAAS